MIRATGRISACLLLTVFASAPFASGARPNKRSLPVAFELNRGQAPSDFKSLFHRDGMCAAFSRDQVEVAAPAAGKAEDRLTIEFLWTTVDPLAEGQQLGGANYFLGNDHSRWIRNVLLYPEVTYSELYLGISLRFYGNGGKLEHDFIVSPGADPSAVALKLTAQICGCDLWTSSW